MADSQIEEIKNKLNILDVIGGYIKLTKTGINHRGICPFHSEKTPSFFVSPTRQMWHCFGCGIGGDCYAFIMKIEGVEFGDALRILAQKAGVTLKRENIQLRTERQRLYEVCELACRFFERQLEGEIGKEAKDYLLKRGINEASVKKWRLGYSPDTWNGLTDFLIGKGYKREEIIKAGLAINKAPRPHEGAGVPVAEGDLGKGIRDSYDRFRGRIIFPVFNINGQPIGFGGRVFKQAGETAKYINTPQTLLYDKSSVLYGLNNAKLAVRKENQCVVTEGYTDVIMAHQAGFENTVASSGTALTSTHLEILKRYAENLVLAFDMDVAGDSATKRGINLAQEQGFGIKIIESYGSPSQVFSSTKDDKGKTVEGEKTWEDKGNKKSDPADIIAKDPKIWQDSLSKAKSIMDFYFDSAYAKFDKSTPEGKKEISKILLNPIKRIANKIEQSFWTQKLAQDLAIREEAVLEELAKINIYMPVEQQSGSIQIIKEPNPIQRKQLLQEKVISLILKNPDHLFLIDQSHYALFSEKTGRFFEEIKKHIKEKVSNEGELKADFKILLDEKSVEFDAEFKSFLAALALRADVEYKEDGKEEVELCLLQLKNIQLKDKLNKISDDIKSAESQNDHQKVNDLIGEFNKLTKEL